MRRHRLAHSRPVAVDEVENALGHAGLVENLGEYDRVKRRDLAWLEHHRAAGGDPGRDFAGDLVERPIPRRDQADDADRLAHDDVVALFVLENVVLEDFDHFLQMLQADRNLVVEREGQGRAHLLRHGDRQVAAALLVDGDDPAQQLQALAALRKAERLKGALGGGDRLVDIRFRAERNLREGVFVRGVYDVESMGNDRIDPGSVDVKLPIVRHRIRSLLRNADCFGQRFSGHK